MQKFHPFSLFDAIYGCCGSLVQLGSNMLEMSDKGSVVHTKREIGHTGFAEEPVVGKGPGCAR